MVGRGLDVGTAHLLTAAQNEEGLVVEVGFDGDFAVVPEHRKRGFEGVLLGEGLEQALELGYDWCENSWILEYNELTKRAVRLMDGELYKVYRVYQKEIVSAEGVRGF